MSGIRTSLDLIKEREELAEELEESYRAGGNYGTIAERIAEYDGFHFELIMSLQEKIGYEPTFKILKVMDSKGLLHYGKGKY